MNYNIISSDTRYNIEEVCIRDASRRIKLKPTSLKNVSKFYKKEDSMAFKIGEKVIIRDHLKDIEHFTGGFVSDMEKHVGKTVTIASFSQGGNGVHFKEVCWCWDIRAIKKIENENEEIEEGEKIMINYEDILRIYRERKRTEYEEKRDEKRGKFEDAYSKLRDEYNKKFLEQLKKDNREFCYESHKMTNLFESEERIKENTKINEEYHEKINKLDTLIEEVKAQLKLCTTREETLEILKLYKIVDKSGKIYGCEE